MDQAVAHVHDICLAVTVDDSTIAVPSSQHVIREMHERKGRKDEQHHEEQQERQD
jgi:hypothetical protein